MRRGRRRTVGGAAAEVADASATCGPVREDLLSLTIPTRPLGTGGEVCIKYCASDPWRCGAPRLGTSGCQEFGSTDRNRNYRHAGSSELVHWIRTGTQYWVKTVRKEGGKVEGPTEPSATIQRAGTLGL
eukprot:3230727-Pyramimonas_sp.AAC.1